MGIPTNLVVLLDKLLMSFLALLTVSLLMTGTSVAAPPPEHDETVILVGPNIDPLSISVSLTSGIATVATQRVYNGINIVEGQSVKVDLTWTDVPGNCALVAETCIINQFKYEVFVNDSPMDTKNLGRTSMSGIHPVYTTPGSYRIVLTGMQGVTQCWIVVDEQP